MKLPICVFSALLVLTGCQTAASSAQLKQTEVAIHTMRSEIEELKNDLTSHQMELDILQEKLLTHENSLVQLREESLEKALVRLEKMQALVGQMDRKIAQLEKQQEEGLVQLKQFAQMAQDASRSSLLNYDSLNRLEGQIHEQKSTLAELLKLKKEILAQIQEQDCQNYKVKPSDTLEKIAKQFNTTTSYLKKINRLSDDRIIAGDVLLVPGSDS